MLKDRCRVLGTGHPATLRTRHRLVSLLEHVGRLSEAITELQILLDENRRVLGEEHPYTLKARRHLTDLLGRAGKLGATGVGDDKHVLIEKRQPLSNP